MRSKLLIGPILLLPLNVAAVYFPGGVDWTNPSQSSFVQSLYLNVLGRAPASNESQEKIRALRRNDNRIARLRIFESILESSEYQRVFQQTGNWQVYRAPDYNYNNGDGFWRYQASAFTPDGFSDLPRGSRRFSESIARAVANYYNAFCYRGEPCIDNPELARDRGSVPLATTVEAHACADPSQLNSQFKWVAINGTTYPRGIGRDTVCMQDHYYKVSRQTLQRYDCDNGFTNCERNATLDLRATRSGTDNNRHEALFFRDGTRLALIDVETSTDNTGVTSSGSNTNTDAALLGNAHDCADLTKTTSRFLWQGPGGRAVSNGIGATIICMDNYYYTVKGLTLERFQCQSGFTDCRADSQNDLTAQSRTTVDGNRGLLFSNGTTLTITKRGSTIEPRTNETRTNSTTNRNRPQTDNTGVVLRRSVRPSGGCKHRDDVSSSTFASTTGCSTTTATAQPATLRRGLPDGSSTQPHEPRFARRSTTRRKSSLGSTMASWACPTASGIARAQHRDQPTGSAAPSNTTCKLRHLNAVSTATAENPANRFLSLARTQPPRMTDG